MNNELWKKVNFIVYLDSYVKNKSEKFNEVKITSLIQYYLHSAEL
jgi:hypothetical protein